MKQCLKLEGKKGLVLGVSILLLFCAWTRMIQTIDVKIAGPNDSEVGFATWNIFFHQLTGVHMTIYTITDWLGLVPIFICCVFGVVGLVQLIKRRSLFKVDLDIILLGIYYILVIFGYLFFEMVPINYRPILIEGILEASYPSSTTLLVLSVMPTLYFQVDKRVANPILKLLLKAFSVLFSIFMVGGRLCAGVHWFTDIVGGILLSAGLYMIYKASATLLNKK